MSTRPMPTQREAAAACGVSRRTIRRRREAGDLPGAVQDEVRGWLIPVDDLLAAGFRLHAPTGPDDAAPPAPDGKGKHHQEHQKHQEHDDAPRAQLAAERLPTNGPAEIAAADRPVDPARRPDPPPARRLPYGHPPAPRRAAAPGHRPLRARVGAPDSHDEPVMMNAVDRSGEWPDAPTARYARIHAGLPVKVTAVSSGQSPPRRRSPPRGRRRPGHHGDPLAAPLDPAPPGARPTLVARHLAPSSRRPNPAAPRAGHSNRLTTAGC